LDKRLRPGQGADKAQSTRPAAGVPMALYLIAATVIIFGLLNLIEFGRLD